MSKYFGGGRSEERFGNRLIRRAHFAKVVGQNSRDGVGARRHPELELVVVIERLARHQIRVIGVGIRMGYSGNWILWKHHLLPSEKPWERRHPCLQASGKGRLIEASRQGCLRSQGFSLFQGVAMRYEDSSECVGQTGGLPYSSHHSPGQPEMFHLPFNYGCQNRPD